MMGLSLLPPLPVVGPLAIAGLLLMASHLLPRPLPDIIALLTAGATSAVCLLLMRHTVDQPLVYWFGGWIPRQGFPVGIGFVIDPISALLGAFIALLFFATLVFAWGYYDEVHAHFHVLMLLFMGGMIGFCFTHDLFNMFVWFEVMSIAGFALTGYQLRTSALEGALNFTVTNAVGSYLFLAGIALIYSRLGTLDFAALERGVAAQPHDEVVMSAFVMLATALLIKAAQVPFQAWLADAHAVAPSPVSVIFSGAMVSIGIYGIAKLAWSVFALSAEIQHAIRVLLLAMGAFSTLVGGVMALLQRHIKRMLAFSTISHVGFLLIGVALWDRRALAGMLVYFIGHGLVKGALFMVAGIFLALCGSIDEIQLRGHGRRIWPAGIVMAMGGLLLAGLPVGMMSGGSNFIAAGAKASGQGWLLWIVIVGAACTGGAVLRTSGRVFLGFGPVPGEERHSPTEDDKEKADRPLWLMLAPTITLLSMSLVGTGFASNVVSGATLRFMHPDNAMLLDAAPPLRAAADVLLTEPIADTAWVSVALGLAIAAFGLFHQNLPRRAMMRLRRAGPMLAGLRTLHSGDVRQYVMWMVVGLVAFAVVFAVS
jgi:multicomponent Na+:H+ antiporter subunit D